MFATVFYALISLGLITLLLGNLTMELIYRRSQIIDILRQAYARPTPQPKCVAPRRMATVTSITPIRARSSLTLAYAA